MRTIYNDLVNGRAIKDFQMKSGTEAVLLKTKISDLIWGRCGSESLF